MKTKIIYFVLLMAVTAMLGIQSCGKGSPCEGRDMTDEITVYTIADSIKAKIPYTGWDTLVFVSDAGDTATLYGKGEKQNYDETRNTRGGDCPQTTISKYENIRIDFLSGGQLRKIEIYLYKKTYDPKQITGCEIIIDNQINRGFGFEYILYHSPIHDSILLNGTYITGGYVGNVLYNVQFGILKFNNIQNKTWTKI